jgi:hypothetical protein
MCLLPRSPAGTWTLAAIMSAATCVVVWVFLPVLPRTNLRLPPDAELLGLGPNAETALVLRNAWCPNGEDFDHQVLEMFETSSGRSTAILIDNCGHISVSGTSADGQTWLLCETGITRPRLLRLDLPTCTIHPLTANIPDSRYFGHELSPDGRLCVLEEKATNSLVVWDAILDKQHALLPGLTSPMAFAVDSRSFVAVIAEPTKNRVSVIDLTTMATRQTLTVNWESASEMIREVRLNADGSYVIAEISGWEEFSPRTWCCNVATGRLRFGGASLPCGEHGRLVGHNTIVAEMYDSPGLKWFDLDTGEQTATAPSEHGAPWGLSPDGKTVMAFVVEKGNGPIEGLAKRIGFNWPFRSSGRVGVAFYDAASGRHMGNVPAQWDQHFIPHLPEWRGPRMICAPNGRVMAIGNAYQPDKPEHWGQWTLWDIPPRKSLTWFAIATAVLALPLAAVAWRRSRHLRREAA